MKRSWSGPFLLLCVLALGTHPLMAASHWVGTCHAKSFATIMAAIQSPTVVAGDILNICPGDYSEQVIVSKPLTLQGLNSKNNEQVRISSNDSVSLRTTASAVFDGVSAYYPWGIVGGVLPILSPVIWITSGPVTIQNLYVYNAYLSSSCKQSSEYYPVLQKPAFFFQAGSLGRLDHVIAQGDCGPAVWAEGTETRPGSVTVANSIVHGIVAASQQTSTTPSLAITISQNQLISVAHGSYDTYGPGCSVSSDPSTVYPAAFLYMTAGRFEHNAVRASQYASGNCGTVLQNNPLLPSVWWPMSVGISDSAPAVTVSSNTLVDLDTGIALNLDGTVVKSNTILFDVYPGYSLFSTRHFSSKRESISTAIQGPYRPT